MKKLLLSSIVCLIALVAGAQTLRVQGPAVVGLDEQFNLTFVFEGEEQPSDFSWPASAEFKVVWGPQKGSSTSIQIINGKTTRSVQHTFTYVLMPTAKGKFPLPSASVKVKGQTVSSQPFLIEVVGNGASAPSGGQSASQSRPQQPSATGEIAADDLFMRLILSRNRAVVGEPVTATLKLYQRVSISGVDDARLPSFDGFWSQETETASQIQFRRETYNDKIYEAAVLKRWVLIPQRTGDIRIDPSELMCAVNVRAPRRSGSIFDDFFDDGYRTVRKRISTPALTFHVDPLPAGAPASFGGGVGEFTLSARLTKDSLRTHDATSLKVTLSGRGNVSLLEAPKVSFPPDMDVYDTKATENTDKASGGISGSKTFEYPFIPRSHGEFTIGPVQYTYYDVKQGRYVTLTSQPMTLRVAKGNVQEAAPGGPTLPQVERKGVRNLGDDIRYVATRRPDLSRRSVFLVGSVRYWVTAMLLVLAALAIWLGLRRAAARKADVAGARNRAATKQALRRLKTAHDFLEKDLQTAFYEELHRALLGFVADKLNIGAEDLNKETIAQRLSEGGVPEGSVQAFTDLLDACEFARYAPSGGNEAMAAHYRTAVDTISSIDASMKKKPSVAARALLALLLLAPLSARAQEAPTPEQRWDLGLAAYEEGQWEEAYDNWKALSGEGVENVALTYNLGNAAFKAGRLPEAILWWERTLRLDPSHADARFNLDLARTQTQDRIDEVPEFILKAWNRKLCYGLSSNTWAVLSLVLLALTLGLVLLFLLAPRQGARRAGFFAGLATLLLTLLCFHFARWQYKDFRRDDAAIVMVPVSTVKSSPSAGSAKDLFVLHEGTKVRLLDDVGEWKNISLADGRQGWIRGDEIEII